MRPVRKVSFSKKKKNIEIGTLRRAVRVFPVRYVFEQKTGTHAGPLNH